MTAHRFFAAGIVCFVIAATAYGTLRATFGPRPVYVHVRWAASVDDLARQQLERQYHLVEAEPEEGRTWGYTLLDASRGNVRSLIIDAAVEDTHYLHRTAFRAGYFSPRRPYRTTAQWIPLGLSALSAAAVLAAFVAIGLGGLERVAPRTTVPWIALATRVGVLFGLIVALALGLRIYLAATAPYIHDEENASIPRAQEISFAADDLQLPLRGRNHPALPAYFVKVSSLLFGTTRLGYRMLHVLAGIGVVAMVFLVARRWYGPVAALWASALLAFNEYFLNVSSRATAHVPYLLFTGSTIVAFGRFLTTQRPVYLYVAALALGLAFYAKEHSALLLPVLLAFMLQPTQRRWFRSVHVYLAPLLYVLVIAADVVWNLRARDEIQQATYGDHLERIGGLGLSPYPLMFYLRDVVQPVWTAVAGSPLVDATPEYPSVNPALGVLFLAAMIIAMFRESADKNSRMLVFVFMGVFGFFTLIRPGGSPNDLDPVSWIWVDVTLFPAVILAGAALARADGQSRAVLWTLIALALAAACVRVVA